jgi:hypothetical protein
MYTVRMYPKFILPHNTSDSRVEVLLQSWTYKAQIISSTASVEKTYGQEYTFNR